MKKTIALIEVIVLMLLSTACFESDYDNTHIIDSKISPDMSKMIVLQEKWYGLTISDKTEVYISDLKCFKHERICGCDNYLSSIKWLDNNTILIDDHDILEEDVYERRNEIWEISIKYTR